MLAYHLVLFPVAVGLLFWQASLLLAALRGSPIVYADKKAIRDCLKLAGLSSGQTVIDLGCGDARVLVIAAKEFGAKGTGVDRSLYCYLRSKINVWRSGQAGNIRVVWGDFRRVKKELHQAEVAYLYLLNETLAEIERWLFDNIGKRSKVVSLGFSFPNHRTIKLIETHNLGRPTKIRLYLK
mgnify:CR=1 FL=1